MWRGRCPPRRCRLPPHGAVAPSGPAARPAMSSCFPSRAPLPAPPRGPGQQRWWWVTINSLTPSPGQLGGGAGVVSVWLHHPQHHEDAHVRWNCGHQYRCIYRYCCIRTLPPEGLGLTLRPPLSPMGCAPWRQVRPTAAAAAGVHRQRPLRPPALRPRARGPIQVDPPTTSLPCLHSCNTGGSTDAFPSSPEAMAESPPPGRSPPLWRFACDGHREPSADHPR